MHIFIYKAFPNLGQFLKIEFLGQMVSTDTLLPNWFGKRFVPIYILPLTCLFYHIFSSPGCYNSFFHVGYFAGQRMVSTWYFNGLLSFMHQYRSG